MSLKDHLRSLGDKEFLQELANSESDLQDKEGAKPDKNSTPKGESDKAQKAKKKDAGGEDFDLAEPSAAEPSESLPAEAVTPLASPPAAESRNRASSEPAAGVEDMLKVVVKLEADSREGKGFIIDQEGRIVTNLHLVEGASRLRVSLPSGDIFLGRLLKSDKAHDLALIQIPARTPQHVRLGNYDSLDVGEDVFVLGKASSALGKMVRAVICGLRMLDGTSLIQVNQSVAEADSGSPFVAPDGAVIGISNCRMGDDVADSGFAVSVKDLQVFVSR